MKGFTLVELLGIIIILGVVALICFPKVNSMIKQSKQDAYDAQVKNIVDSARSWAVDNNSKLPQINSSSELRISILDLINEGYINDTKNNNLVNPLDETKTMDGCVIIKYFNEYNQYSYEYSETCES